MIFANGKLYTIIDHVIAKNLKRGIRLEWIEAVMNEPERLEISESSAYEIYIGQVPGRTQPLFVVVDEHESQIVTVYFLDPH